MNELDLSVDIDELLKADLQEYARALRARVLMLQAALEEAQPEPAAPDLPADCINCHQASEVIVALDDGRFRCPACGHIWTRADERAPHRRPLRL